MKRLRRFFFPPPGSSLLRRLIPLAALVALGVFIVIAVIPGWEYTNSPSFCGTVCHTMPPEYHTYLVSPHARVLCVDCHIGRGSFFQQITRKSVHMRLIYLTVTHQYEYPIMASELRPARETCERCHFPAKFSDDSLRAIHTFEDNATNDPYDIYLLMHTGGGTQREGLGRGIHWHTENKIEYVATDKREQTIPWVRVHTADGKTIDYVEQGVDASQIDKSDAREMDCMTCHNRIAHLINKPTRAVDSALYQGDLSPDIPYIRKQAVDVLAAEYKSKDQARQAISSLDQFYATNYPDFYAQNQQKVSGAISLLEELYDQNNFPEQELNWETHPNNVGHRDSPGCFRCHDGQHFSASGEAIRLECNLCHSIPQVVTPGEIEPTMPLTTGIEPASHLSTTWIKEHHNAFDNTCQNCHTVEDAGGTTNVSFCSNSACHGVDWKYANFNAPALAEEIGIGPAATEEPLPSVQEPVTYALLQPILTKTCGRCHGETATKGLNVTTYATLMAGSEDGPVISPGAPEHSKIIEVLSKGHFAQLSDEEMALLRQWIVEGAPEGEPIAAATEAPPAATESAPAQAVGYDTLQPILLEACGRCHGETKTKGLKVTEYDTLMAGGQDGPVIVPGDPDHSLIVQKLEAGHFGKLTDDQMALLKQWIAAGAPETASAPAATEAPAAAATEAAPTEAVPATEAATAAVPAPETATEAAASGEKEVTYVDLQPILEETCGKCHGEAKTKGLKVTEYDTLMAGGQDGPVIVPGDPDHSLIVQKLEAGHYAQLTDEQMALLKQWIAAGAPESPGAAATEQAPQASSGTDEVHYSALQPKLEAACGKCHGDAKTKGLKVTEYDTLMAGGEDGPVVTPGDPDGSLIVQKLEAGHYGKLSDEDMALLKQWIAAGAPE